MRSNMKNIVMLLIFFLIFTLITSCGVKVEGVPSEVTHTHKVTIDMENIALLCQEFDVGSVEHEECVQNWVETLTDLVNEGGAQFSETNVGVIE